MTTTRSSPQCRYNAIVLIVAMVAVASGGFVEATESCAAVQCPVNSTCKDGKCKLICPGGYENCNGKFDDGCEVNMKAGDVMNCGRCGAECRKPKPKSNEIVECVDGRCEYTEICIARCATFPNSRTTCKNNSCHVTCDPGFGNCNEILELGKDGCEVDLRTDVNNCGKCGYKCPKPRFYGKATCSSTAC